MKRYTISMLIIVILISVLTTVTYAWFTYVERKSLATFEAGDISITTHINDTLVVNDFNLGTLAYFDFHKDLINDTHQVFDLMASSVTVQIKNGSKSPLTRHQIEILNENNPNGLVYFIIYEGLNPDLNTLESNYHQVIQPIVSTSTDIEDFLINVNIYNEQVLAFMGQTTTTNDDTLVFQIVSFGLYDIVDDQENYLNLSYSLSLVIHTINAKGQVV